jgi:hypothetical protein
MSRFFSRLFASLLTLAVVVGGSNAQPTPEEKYEEVLRKLLDTLDQTTKTLEKIVDEDSAKANTMDLREQASAFIAARKQSETLAPPSTEVRERLAAKYRHQFEKVRKVLGGQVARVATVPGGNTALQEIRGVFEKNAP